MAYEGFLRSFSTTSLEKKEQMALSINQEIATILQKEGISAPPVEFEVALISHSSKKDAHNLAEGLKTCDVFIPEMFGSSPEEIAIYNKLSQGDLKVNEAYRELLTLKYGSTVRGSVAALFKKPIGNFPNFFIGLLEIISNSKKKIAHVDIGYNNPLLEKIVDGLRDIEIASANAVFSRLTTFQESRDEISKAYEAFGATQKLREQHMLKNLAPAIAETIKQNVDLQHPSRTKPIRVYMYLGATHTTIPSEIYARGDTVKVTRAKNTGGESSLEKVTKGVPLTEAEKDSLTLFPIVTAVYRFAPKQMKKNLKDFTDLYGDQVFIQILTDVYTDQAEKLYVQFKKGLGTLRESELKKSSFIAQFFHTLLTERAPEIEKAMQKFSASQA